MATNYDHQTKTQVDTLFLTPAGVSHALVTQILKTLGNSNHVVVDGSGNQVLTAADVKGQQVVISDSTVNDGTLDLSGITAAQIAGVKDFTFTGNHDVTFTLGPVTPDATHKAVNFNGVVTTGEGNDTITIHSTQGATIDAGAGDNHITLGAGNNTVVAGDGANHVEVGNGNNKITLGNGDNTVLLGDGKDTVVTGSGNDTITGGNGNDSISTGAGNDSITTGSGKDTIFAGAGNDTIHSGAGNDSISTGTGNDSVDAGAGNDNIYVGGEHGDVKVIDGGAGNDIVKLALGYAGNATIDGAGGDSANLVKASDVDTLDLRYAVIKDVVQDQGQADHLTITLKDDSVLNVQHFEKFIYDTSTTDVDGGDKSIKLTGLDQFLAQFHHSS